MSLTHGIKGSDVYDSTGSELVDLSTMLNRGLPALSIATSLEAVFAKGSTQDKVDAFVLAFQTRDVRGGKGERDLFYHMMQSLMMMNSTATKATLPLIPEYGCWRDVFKLDAIASEQLRAMTVAQLKKDASTPEDQSISLLAKHAPREHCKADKPLATALAQMLNPKQPKAQELYRKMLSGLNKRLQTVEVAMCAKDFSSIDPAKVPGRCLKVHTKAFLNQAVKGKHGRKVPSADLDRITAAQHFADHFALAKMGKVKVNGAHTVYPHELVSKVLYHLQRAATCSQEELDAIEAQWLAIVKPIKDTGALSRTLAMCDFSGSMSGDPMNVSMALGLIIAECNTGVFKDTILTFDSTPTLHKFKTSGLVNRVSEVMHLAQGLSTDFQAAYNLVLQTMKTMSVAAGEEPKDLIVLTDMGWDAACGHGQHSAYTGAKYEQAVKTKAVETHPQIARRAFKLASQQLFGDDSVGWQPPRIVIWNLRAEFKDFHSSALEAGVVQVAGWSPSLLKVLMTKGADAMTPTAMLRAMLDDERYDAVRQAVTPLLQ